MESKNQESIMNRILIVEDDETIALSLANHLKKWDYETIVATNFKDIVELFIKEEPHLILMDISLPFFNGYHWCNEIRKISKVPIIFISSATDNMNIVMAMNMGGDDFIAKPFDLAVVAAKIQALIRRSYSYVGQMNVIEYKGVVLNLNETALIYKQDKLELTKNDFRIIHTLLENPETVISREDIMTKLWESDSFIDDNTLTVNVTRLRKKLSDFGLKDFIITKKGIGYMVML